MGGLINYSACPRSHSQRTVGVRCLSGLPKAAVVNQNRLLTALAVLASNGVSASDIIYLNLPLYHTAGFIIGFVGSIETGELPPRYL